MCSSALFWLVRLLWHVHYSLWLTLPKWDGSSSTLHGTFLRWNYANFTHDLASANDKVIDILGNCHMLHRRLHMNSQQLYSKRYWKISLKECWGFVRISRDLLRVWKWLVFSHLCIFPEIQMANVGTNGCNI